MNYPTPHIKATPADFGQTVLMPGDPLRAKYIAEHFLKDPVLVNNVRGVQGYTGSYKDVRVSVMASGMGMPSIGIYSRELYEAYNVRNIMRIGSAGAIQPDINLKDIVMAMGASMDSNYQAQFHLMGTFAPICSFEMLHAATQSAEELGAVYHVGNILSSDFFYDDDEGVPEALDPKKNWQKMGIMAIEMESAALYLNAARLRKNALCICTVSDQLVRHEYLSADERQTGFEQMMKVALETAVKLEK
ncbi:MAG: purine-nucleoside phosphorylase [Oscillospiraceae bacterium]|nr:purine-nucleoside phosphorylase [Oscillospiraceae bacterium]